MNKRRNKLDMEKIFATVFSLALLVALIVGITSILKDNNSESDGKKNYVDLNELAMETSSDELVNMAGSETQNNTNEDVDIANNKTDIKDDKKNENQMAQLESNEETQGEEQVAQKESGEETQGEEQIAQKESGEETQGEEQIAQKESGEETQGEEQIAQKESGEETQGEEQIAQKESGEETQGEEQVAQKESGEETQGEEQIAQKESGEETQGEEQVAQLETITENTGEKQQAAATIEDETIATPVSASTATLLGYTFNENSSMLWPVEGDIILNYNMSNTIYFPSLNVYKCNPAIVIKANEGDFVRAAADGLVIAVYETAQTGISVDVAIGGDYIVTYGQLKDLAVEVGAQIKKGDVIANVAVPTPYYSVEGTNLYFSVRNNGAFVDPMEYIEEVLQ